MSEPIPAHLGAYATQYALDPRAASRAWFRDARFGLFMHYGVYSLLGRGEWVMLREKIPVAEYERLKDRFSAERFDARGIAALAVSAGMRYITITARHHDSFCLFRTAATDFSSAASPGHRDLIGELAEACRAHGLGLFLYYSYALDWRHPYFYPLDSARGFAGARPAYERPDPAYRFRSDADFRRYLEFVHAQLRELLTQYGPIAGMWFDPIMGYYYRPDLFPIEETYALVRSLQPHCLIAFKQGASGDEDFASPERAASTLADRLRQRGAPADAVRVADAAWRRNSGKWNEICETLQPAAWGFVDMPDGERRGPDDVMRMLAAAAASRCNLLLNTGPLPDGSIHPVDQATLREVGARLRRSGFPPPAEG